MLRYGNTFRYKETNVGQCFEPITVRLTQDMVNSYKKALKNIVSAENPNGLVLLDRFFYSAIQGQFPDGNLRTSLRMKLTRPLKLGETFKVQAQVKDKYVKRSWYYIVIQTRWMDATREKPVAEIEWVHATERRKSNENDR